MHDRTDERASSPRRSGDARQWRRGKEGRAGKRKMKSRGGVLGMDEGERAAVRSHSARTRSLYGLNLSSLVLLGWSFGPPGRNEFAPDRTDQILVFFSRTGPAILFHEPGPCDPVHNGLRAGPKARSSRPG